MAWRDPSTPSPAHFARLQPHVVDLGRAPAAASAAVVSAWPSTSRDDDAIGVSANDDDSAAAVALPPLRGGGASAVSVSQLLEAQERERAAAAAVVASRPRVADAPDVSIDPRLAAAVSWTSTSTRSGSRAGLGGFGAIMRGSRSHADVPSIGPHLSSSSRVLPSHSLLHAVAQHDTADAMAGAAAAEAFLSARRSASDAGLHEPAQPSAVSHRRDAAADGSDAGTFITGEVGEPASPGPLAFDSTPYVRRSGGRGVVMVTDAVGSERPHSPTSAGIATQPAWAAHPPLPDARMVLMGVRSTLAEVTSAPESMMAAVAHGRSDNRALEGEAEGWDDAPSRPLSSHSRHAVAVGDGVGEAAAIALPALTLPPISSGAAHDRGAGGPPHRPPLSSPRHPQPPLGLRLPMSPMRVPPPLPSAASIGAARQHGSASTNSLVAAGAHIVIQQAEAQLVGVSPAVASRGGAGVRRRRFFRPAGSPSPQLDGSASEAAARHQRHRQAAAGRGVGASVLGPLHPLTGLPTLSAWLLRGSVGGSGTAPPASVTFATLSSRGLVDVDVALLPDFTSLTTLDVSDNLLGWGRAVIVTPRLSPQAHDHPSPTHTLTLADTPPGSAIASIGLLPALHTLSLACNCIGAVEVPGHAGDPRLSLPPAAPEAHMSLLTVAPPPTLPSPSPPGPRAFARLQTLDLSHNPLHPLGLQTLLAAVSPTLRHLNIASCSLVCLPLTLLRAGGLEVVDASHNQLSSPEDLILLSRLPRLTQLDLSHNRFTSVPHAVVGAVDAGDVYAHAHHGHFGALCEGQFVTWTGAAVSADGAAMYPLSHVDTMAAITADPLCVYPLLPALAAAGIPPHPLSVEALVGALSPGAPLTHYLSSQGFQRLVRLDLSHNPLSPHDDAITSLMAAPVLREVALWGTPLAEEAMRSCGAASSPRATEASHLATHTFLETRPWRDTAAHVAVRPVSSGRPPRPVRSARQGSAAGASLPAPGAAEAAATPAALEGGARGSGVGVAATASPSAAHRELAFTLTRPLHVRYRAFPYTNADMVDEPAHGEEEAMGMGSPLGRSVSRLLFERAMQEASAAATSAASVPGAGKDGDGVVSRAATGDVAAIAVTVAPARLSPRGTPPHSPLVASHHQSRASASAVSALGRGRVAGGLRASEGVHVDVGGTHADDEDAAAVAGGAALAAGAAGGWDGDGGDHDASSTAADRSSHASLASAGGALAPWSGDGAAPHLPPSRATPAAHRTPAVLHEAEAPAVGAARKTSPTSSFATAGGGGRRAALRSSDALARAAIRFGGGRAATLSPPDSSDDDEAGTPIHHPLLVPPGADIAYGRTTGTATRGEGEASGAWAAPQPPSHRAFRKVAAPADRLVAMREAVAMALPHSSDDDGSDGGGAARASHSTAAALAALLEDVGSDGPHTLPSATHGGGDAMMPAGSLQAATRSLQATLGHRHGLAAVQRHVAAARKARPAGTSALGTRHVAPGGAVSLAIEDTAFFTRVATYKGGRSYDDYVSVRDRARTQRAAATAARGGGALPAALRRGSVEGFVSQAPPTAAERWM